MAGRFERSAALLALVASAACWPPWHDVASLGQVLDDERAAHMGRELGARAVLVTIDGARWQEVFGARDLMPNLHRRAADGGALVGAPGRGEMVATGPAYVSLPGYTEILGGRAPLECQDNECPRVTHPTILDEAYAAGATVAAFASWERIDRAVSVAPTRFVTSCGRDGNTSIDPYPGHGDYRPDRFTASLALRHLERARPDVLFLALGDTDEYAHRGDYVGYLRALRFADDVLGRIFDELDRMGPAGAKTNVIVTTDHGRAHDFVGHGARWPESARVWLFAAGPDVVARGAVVSLEPRRLADVAPTMRAMLGIGLGGSRAASGRAIAELLEPPREGAAVSTFTAP